MSTVDDTQRQAAELTAERREHAETLAQLNAAMEEVEALRDSTKFGYAIMASAARVNEQRARAEKAEAELAGARQAESALRVERDAARADVARLTARLDEYRREVERRDELLHGADEDLKTERAANALLSATVTTLTEQRDLAAAEAERLRAVAELARKAIAELIVCGCTSDEDMSDVMPQLVDALASPSTAAQVLDAAKRLAWNQGNAAAWHRATEDAKQGFGTVAGHEFTVALAECDERVRAEARGMTWKLEHELRREAEAKLADVTAERDALKAALEDLIYKPPDVSKDRDGLADRIRAALAMVKP